MNKLIALLLLFIPLITKGQIDVANMSVGAVFSPDLCYRSLKSDVDLGVQLGKDRDDLETPKFGYTLGLSFKISLGNRVALESGMLFSDKGYKYKLKPDNSVNNPADPNLPVKIRREYHYNYIDVPVKVNYYVTQHKVRLFISAGTSANILLFQKLSSKYEFQNGSIERKSDRLDEGLSRVNVAALAGFGADYDLTENITIRVEPIYRRSVTSIINAPIKGYLYSGGVNFGLYFNL